MRSAFWTLSSMLRRRLKRSSSNRRSRGSHRRLPGGSNARSNTVIEINDSSNKVLERCEDTILVTDGESQSGRYEGTQRVLDFDDADLSTPIGTLKRTKSVKKPKPFEKNTLKSNKNRAKRAVIVDTPGPSEHTDTCRETRGRKRKKEQNDDKDTPAMKEQNEVLRKRKKSKRDDFPTIKTRSSPFQFFRCISVLSLEQQLAVKEMGFGKLLKFRMDGVPLKLAYFVVDSFDPERMEINAPCGTMKVNSKVVENLLGIPRGGVKLMSTEKKCPMDKAVKKWRKRYKSKLVSAKSMVDNIERSDGEDSFDFRMDFLMCFVTVMVDCHKQGTLREGILYHISKNMKISDIDWCGLIVDKLRDCKKTWDRLDPQSPFTGPLATLTLLYVDRATCKGMAVDYSVYPITYWTTQRLKEREKLEIVNGGFGKGDLKRLSITCVINNDSSVKDKVQLVEKNIDEILRNKKKIEDVLAVLCEEHPGDVEVQTLKARYASLMDDKPSWIRDVAAGEQIQNVLNALNNNDDDVVEADCSDGVGEGDCSSPIVSQYRKSMAHGVARSSDASIDIALGKMKEGEAGTEPKGISVNEGDVRVSGAGSDLVRRKSPRLRATINKGKRPLNVGVKEGEEVTKAKPAAVVRKSARNKTSKGKDVAEPVLELCHAARKKSVKGTPDVQARETPADPHVEQRTSPRQDPETSVPIKEARTSAVDVPSDIKNDQDEHSSRVSPDVETVNEMGGSADIEAKKQSGDADSNANLDFPAVDGLQMEQRAGPVGICEELAKTFGGTDKNVVAEKADLAMREPSKSIHTDTQDVRGATQGGATNVGADKQSLNEPEPARLGGSVGHLDTPCRVGGEEPEDRMQHNVGGNISEEQALTRGTKTGAGDDYDYDGPTWSVGLTQMDVDSNPRQTGLGAVAGETGPTTLTCVKEPGSGKNEDVGDGPGHVPVEVNVGKGKGIQDKVNADIPASYTKPGAPGNVKVVKPFKNEESSSAAATGSGVLNMDIDVTNILDVAPMNSFDGATGVYVEGPPVVKTCQGGDKTPVQNVLLRLDASRRNPLRERLVAPVNRSPFFIRGVDLQAGVTKEDEQIWSYIYVNETLVAQLLKERVNDVGQSTKGDVGTTGSRDMEVLFRSCYNLEATRAMFKSLEVGTKVLDVIIDCWVEVLNYEEKYRSEAAKLRLFVGTKAVFDWMLRDRNTSEESRMAKFQSSMKAAVYWSDKMMDLQKYDIIMFPVLEYGHYYLVVFELKYPSISVIDNVAEKSGVPIVDSDNYFEKDTPYKIKDMLVKYLREIKHPRSEVLKGLRIHREKIDWATHNNTEDCGVFVMRHMEKFMGKGERFEAGFSTNGAKKMAELRRLRKKFAAHILRSDVNLLKDKVEAAALRK